DDDGFGEVQPLHDVVERCGVQRLVVDREAGEPAPPAGGAEAAGSADGAAAGAEVAVDFDVLDAKLGTPTVPGNLGTPTVPGGRTALSVRHEPARRLNISAGENHPIHQAAGAESPQRPYQGVCPGERLGEVALLTEAAERVVNEHDNRRGAAARLSRADRLRGSGPRRAC